MMSRRSPRRRRLTTTPPHLARTGSTSKHTGPHARSRSHHRDMSPRAGHKTSCSASCISSSITLAGTIHILPQLFYTVSPTPKIGHVLDKCQAPITPLFTSVRGVAQTSRFGKPPNWVNANHACRLSTGRHHPAYDFATCSLCLGTSTLWIAVCRRSPKTGTSVQAQPHAHHGLGGLIVWRWWCRLGVRWRGWVLNDLVIVAVVSQWSHRAAICFESCPTCCESTQHGAPF